MKIVVLDGYALNPGDMSWAEIEALGECVIHDRTPADKAVERIGDAPIVITNKTLITAEVLAACPALRYIGVLATGYNVVDVRAAAERGVCVTNIPAYSTQSVAQHVFALLLEACSQVGLHNAAVHAGEWSAQRDFCFWKTPLIELAGKTMGIIGFGQIGRGVARIAEAFGMRVLVHSRSHGELSLSEVLREADVVSLHCPLSPETQGMIGRAAIAGMKDGAILINTARGPLVDEQAVREALDSGKLYAACVDVADREPIPADSPLLGAPRCIITPHIAWAPIAARLRLMAIAAENLRQFLRGNEVNRVN